MNKFIRTQALIKIVCHTLLGWERVKIMCSMQCDVVNKAKWMEDSREVAQSLKWYLWLSMWDYLAYMSLEIVAAGVQCTFFADTYECCTSSQDIWGDNQHSHTKDERERERQRYAYCHKIVEHANSICVRNLTINTHSFSFSFSLFSLTLTHIFCEWLRILSDPVYHISSSLEPIFHYIIL